MFREGDMQGARPRRVPPQKHLFSVMVDKGTISPARNETCPFYTISAKCHNFRQPPQDFCKNLQPRPFGVREAQRPSLADNWSRREKSGPGIHSPRSFFESAENENPGLQQEEK